MTNITDCQGKIEWNKNYYDLSFQITVDECGGLKIDFEPIPISKKTKWLLDFVGTKGPFVEHFSIVGKDNLGYDISTDSAYLSWHELRTQANGDFICLQATASELKLESPKSFEKQDLNCKLEYLTVGQLGFELIQVETGLGIIKARGPSDLTDYNKISGFIIIRNDHVSENNFKSWCEECDKMAVSVLDILSLAQGRLIRWSIRRSFIEEELVSVIYFGPKKTTPPIEPLFSHLRLEPILNLAVNNYTQDLREKTGIDVAIKWLLMHPYYLEAEFLAGMTALEHLIYVYNSNILGASIIPSEIFRSSVRPKLTACLDQILEDLKDKIAADEANVEEVKEGLAKIKTNLGNLNNKSFKSNLEQMLNEYQVPLQGIDEADIYSLRNVRNQIVHRGLFNQANTDDKSLHIHTSVLRELLKRIFLTLLKYNGEYQSALNGLEWVKFPP